MRDLLRKIWLEPRAAQGHGPNWRDWILVGALLFAAMLEVAVRPDLPSAGVSLAITIGLLPTLPWRRSRPLAMASTAFGATACIAVARLATGQAFPELSTAAFLLLLPYSLFRWGSGRERVAGATFVLSSSALGLVSYLNRPDDVASGLAVVLTAMAFGSAARHRARARSHELEQAKLLERERLARDLHDTVAHHVSAIAIRAQAGLAVSATVPDAAVDALRLIETEASRTLAEMRAIVRNLRRDEGAELAPIPRIEDLERLATRSAGGPAVEVDVSGRIAELSPSISAAIFRVAQESITNARRHARNATRIEVGVVADESSVRLRVRDDGDPAHDRTSKGYGLVGMIERAELLGGTCHAGPDLERGWTVTAVLPCRERSP